MGRGGFIKEQPLYLISRSLAEGVSVWVFMKKLYTGVLGKIVVVLCPDGHIMITWRSAFLLVPTPSEQVRLTGQP